MNRRIILGVAKVERDQSRIRAAQGHAVAEVEPLLGRY